MFRPKPVLLGALFFGLLFHLGGFFLFQVDSSELEWQSPPKPFLSLVQPGSTADPVLAEQALLEDPEPLFLPTRWNASLSGVSAFGPLEEPDLFSSFPEEVTASEDTFRATLEQRAPRPVAQISSIGDRRPLSFFGRSSIDIRPLPKRHGQVEVRDIRSGRIVRTGALEPIPALAALQFWEPAELLVTVTPLGVTGAPFVSRSTGNDAADTAIRRALSRADFYVLPPGYYSILVGP